MVMNAGHDPGTDQERRRVHFARDLGRNQEDARADHRAHHQHGRAGQAQAFDEFAVARVVRLHRSALLRRHRERVASGQWLVTSAHAGCQLLIALKACWSLNTDYLLIFRPRSTMNNCTSTGHDPPATAFRLYPRIRKNSSADLPGSRTRSDITATESAPASITDWQFARVIPPIATSGFRVSRPGLTHSFQPDHRIGIRLARRRKYRPDRNVIGRSVLRSSPARDCV